MARRCMGRRLLVAATPALLASAYAQDTPCGGAWQFSCDDKCNEGTVFYSPTNLCAPCGGEGQFCCPSDGDWTCGDELSCTIAANPYDSVDANSPYGLARLCVAGVADQSGPTAATPQTTAASCPARWAQCGGRNFAGTHNCCQPGNTCVEGNAWYSQCRPAPVASPPKSPVPPPPTTRPASRPAPPPESAAGARRVHKETGLMEWRDSPSPQVSGAGEWKYELDTMIGQSFFFYELQRAGPQPPHARAPWRADTLKAAAGGNLDGVWQGGYFDAGDHNKFQLPTAYAIARLAWATHAYAGALRKTFFDGESNYHWAREAVKWGADFMVKSVEEGRVLLHIGDIKKDHGYLGRAEDYPQIDRNIVHCAPNKCSDVTGEMAAALAHAAIAFADKPTLAGRYWQHAQLAYAQTGVATKTWGNSNDALADLKVYYPSSGLVSHVFFGAASMYAACVARRCGREAEYLRDARELALAPEVDGGKKWFWEVPSWDNAWWDAAMLLAAQGEAGPDLYGRPVFPQMLAVFADKWVNGKSPVQISPMGQRFTIEWASNRYAMGGAAMLLMWAELPAAMREGTVSPQDARCAAVKQIHYMAGDNDRGSYVVGFGDNPPQRNHHRNGACAPWEQAEDTQRHCEQYFVDVANPRGGCPVYEDRAKGICYRKANRANKFQTHGALVGGPKTPTDAGDPARVPYSREGYNDWRTDWVASEQTLDYNAHFTVALAAALELPASFWTSPCGGTNTDLKLDKKAGLQRKTPKFAAEDAYTFADFQPYGWTRTLRANWFAAFP